MGRGETMSKKHGLAMAQFNHPHTNFQLRPKWGDLKDRAVSLLNCHGRNAEIVGKTEIHVHCPDMGDVQYTVKTLSDNGIYLWEAAQRKESPYMFILTRIEETPKPKGTRI
jgi:hypothetical protein